jgi:N-formylglutamate amidohydrolase
MDFAWWAVDAARPIIATAIHAGHDVRPSLVAALRLDEATRFHEEDPRTGYLAAATGSCVVVNRSRFEVDLNRPRPAAVYLTPDDAWGLELWEDGLSDEEIEASRRLHDGFYQRLGTILDDLVERHGGFVLYDVHSYNDRPPGDEDGPTPLPLVNLGTGSLPPRWRPVAERFLSTIRSLEFAGAPIVAGENVVFEGRQLAQFVHDHYGDVACALAIEFKKDFMDEWSGDVDPPALLSLAAALSNTTDPVWKAHEQCR